MQIDWPRNPTIKFKLKFSFFLATSIVKNSVKEKYMHSGYGITFSSAGAWSLNNDTAKIKLLP